MLDFRNPLVTALPVLLAAAVLCCAPATETSGGEPEIKRLRQVRIEVPADPGLVHLPYFDRRGQLSWDATPVEAVGPVACPESSDRGESATVTRRVARLHTPRVDEVHCRRTDGTLADKSVVGFAAPGALAWQRSLISRSGEHRLETRILGATADALVLSTLEVLSPVTGATILAPPLHRVGSEGRDIPDYDLVYATLFLPERRVFLTFDADVTLVRRQGGLYEVDPLRKTRQQLLALETTLLAAYWHVEAMALDASHRYVFLARRWAYRGPGGVSFAVFDLEGQRLVFSESFGTDHFCAEPRLVVGQGGHVGFSYRDDTTQEVVLTHFHIEAPPPRAYALGGRPVAERVGLRQRLARGLAGNPSPRVARTRAWGSSQGRGRWPEFPPAVATDTPCPCSCPGKRREIRSSRGWCSVNSPGYSIDKQLIR